MLGLLASVAVALAVGLVGTSRLIRWLKAHGIGQPIHEAVAQHATKAGTPTMGGLILPLGCVAGYVVGLVALRTAPSRAGVVLVSAIVAGGLVGAADDWLKIRRGRNTLGLRERQKTFLILAVAAGYATHNLMQPDACLSPSFARCGQLPSIGAPGWALFVVGVIWLTTNSVNFTDGLDGLLAGAATPTLALLAAVAFWEFRHPLTYANGDALDIALVMAALAATCAGLLWWSAAPAAVHMGDTGALALGTGIAVAALALHVELLIPVFGGLYVIEGLSSGVKVAVVDRDGTVLATRSAAIPTTHLPDGGAEQDAEGWWTAIGECSRAIADATVEAVAVTAQYMSIVAIDERGHPLMNAVMWMDRRGARHLRGMEREIDVELWLDRHGLVPIGGCDHGHIATIRAEHPDVYARAAAFVEPVDHLNARLTGRITATQTTAFPLMTVDNRAHGTTEHDRELVARSGLDVATLPPIVPFDEIIGTVTADAAAHLGIPADAVVVTGTIDSITSAVGCGVLDDTSCGVIIGTTTVIVTHIDAKRADLEHGLISVPSPLPGKWFVMAENGVGGKALDHHVHDIAAPGDDPFARAEAAAATVPAGSGGVIYLPWLVGSMAPVADANVRAGFVNIDLQTTRDHLTRAVYEGVAFNAAWLLPHVAAFAGASWPSIKLGGGGAASRLWAQVLADALDTPVERLAGSQTTNARGAALLALVRLGHITLTDIPSLIDVADTFEPDPANVAVYRPMIERFIELHGLLRPNRKDATS